MFKNLASNDFIFIEDPHLPSENMAEFLYWLNKRNIPCYGPIGSGTIFPCFKTREEAHEMYNFILSLRGSAGRLSGVGILRKNFVNETLKEEVKRLKEKLDPNYIMNPGLVI